MNLYKYERLVFSLAIGGLLLLGLFALLHGTSQIAHADPGLLGGGATPATAATEHKPLQGLGDVYCVTPEGGSYAGCTQVFTNVQYAVDAAIGGEIIKVAAGTYTDVHQRSGITQVVRINMSITIQGGYTTTNDFAGPPDPETYPTTLDAGRQGRVVYIVGVTATLEGLRLTNGSISGSGGGICVHTGDIVISGCQVFSNTAGYYGGGVYLYNSANATLTGNEVFSNTANNGSGVFLYQSANATLTGNEVYRNTANNGSGVFLYQSANATLTGNEVYRNTATYSGGGVYLQNSPTATLTGNEVYRNTATDRGGGVFLTSSPTATLTGNDIFSNMTNRGGGVYLYQSANALLTSNHIFSNTANSTGGGVYLWASDDATLTGNQVFSNTANNGGGVYFGNSDTATLTDNDVYSNTVTNYNGGGVCLSDSHGATLTGNQVYRNTADDDGGGIYLNHSANLTMMGNDVYSNTATNNGGGVYLVLSANATLVNNMVLENRITGSGNGAGIYVNSTDAHLLHTTLARNSGGNGHGIYSTNGATLWMTNTILVSHTVGIGVASGATATLTATLWGDGAWANGDDWDGYGAIFTGTVNLWGDPAFVNPNGGDYHITDASAARDAGVDAGVTTDIDGDPRPNGLYDIGADEFYCYALIGVDIAGAVTGAAGTAYAFTATAAPPTATLPISYTWSPEPAVGQSSPAASFTWMTTGTKTITVTAGNCGGVVSNTHTIAIAAPPWRYVYLPLVIKN